MLHHEAHVFHELQNLSGCGKDKDRLLKDIKVTKGEYQGNDGEMVKLGSMLRNPDLLKELKEKVIPYLRRILLKVVIANFVCIEQAQYYARQGAVDQLPRIFQYFSKKFEDLALKVTPALCLTNALYAFCALVPFIFMVVYFRY